MTAISAAHAKGCEAALSRFKIARGTMAPGHELSFPHDHGPTPAPAAAQPSSWSAFNAGARQHVGPRPHGDWDAFSGGAAVHVGDAHNPSAIAMAPRTAKNAPIAPHLPAPTPAAAPLAPTAAPAASPASRFRLPSMGGVKGALGLGALGLLGAGAWGLHKQHQHDVDSRRLTYAPTQGGFY